MEVIGRSYLPEGVGDVVEPELNGAGFFVPRQGLNLIGGAAFLGLAVVDGGDVHGEVAVSQRIGSLTADHAEDAVEGAVGVELQVRAGLTDDRAVVHGVRFFAVILDGRELPAARGEGSEVVG